MSRRCAKRSLCTWWLAALAFTLLLSQYVCANDHYCGVYSVYGVLAHYGHEIPFESLLEPKYITKGQGSNAEKLVAVLRSKGVAAKSYAGLSVFDLRTTYGPVILHVRGSQATREYQHWVIYLGEQDGQAEIYDPSRGRTSMDYARLLALWDSVGIVTAGTQWELFLWRVLGLASRWSQLLLLGIIGVTLTRLIDRGLLPIDQSASWLQKSIAAGALLGVLSTIAIGFDLLHSQSLILSAKARAAITSVHNHTEFETLGLDEAVAMHNDSQKAKSVVWIDARYHDDFAWGHIPGAINLPIDATFTDEDKVLAVLAREKEIVVYCQSEGCAYAHAVGERLKGHGYPNIKIFTPGYNAWSSHGMATRTSPAVNERQ